MTYPSAWDFTYWGRTVDTETGLVSRASFEPRFPETYIDHLGEVFFYGRTVHEGDVTIPFVRPYEGDRKWHGPAPKGRADYANGVWMGRV